MTNEEKSIVELAAEDFQRNPIWEYIFDDIEYPDEPGAKPVKDIPVSSLEGRIVGVKVRLANGQYRWATIRNVHLQNEILTRHLMGITIYDHDATFALVTHGIMYPTHGPEQLAEFLGLPIEDIFPIHYDFAHLVAGHNSLAKGEINKEPVEGLPDDVIIRMIVEDQK